MNQDNKSQNNDARKPVEPGGDIDHGLEGPFEGEYVDDVDPEKIKEKMDDVENDRD